MYNYFKNGVEENIKFYIDFKIKQSFSFSKAKSALLTLLSQYFFKPLESNTALHIFKKNYMLF